MLSGQLHPYYLRMKNTVFLAGMVCCFLLQAFELQAQDSLRVVAIDRFKWTISIPSKFQDFTAEKQEASKKRGRDKIEEVEGITVEDRSVTMIMVQSNKLNYLDAVYQPYENTDGLEYGAYCKEVEEVMYRTFSSRLGGIKLDSSSGKVKVSGLEFQRFYLKGKLPDGRYLKLFMFSRPFGIEEFALNILSVDEADEKALHGAWMSSRFDK